PTSDGTTKIRRKRRSRSILCTKTLPALRILRVLRGTRSTAASSLIHRGRCARQADERDLRTDDGHCVRGSARRRAATAAGTVGSARQGCAGDGEAGAVLAPLPRPGVARARAADLSPRTPTARGARDLPRAHPERRGRDDLRGSVHVNRKATAEIAEFAEIG